MNVFQITHYILFFSCGQRAFTTANHSQPEKTFLFSSVGASTKYRQSASTTISAVPAFWCLVHCICNDLNTIFAQGPYSSLYLFYFASVALTFIHIKGSSVDLLTKILYQCWYSSILIELVKINSMLPIPLLHPASAFPFLFTSHIARPKLFSPQLTTLFCVPIKRKSIVQSSRYPLPALSLQLPTGIALVVQLIWSSSAFGAQAAT